MPTGARILLVCEPRDRRGQRQIREALLQAGFAVESVSGVAAARDRIAADRPEGIVAAYELPDGTGVELCEAVRAHDRDLPVVLVGDRELGAVAEKLFEADVTAYVRRDDAVLETVVTECRSAVDRYRRHQDRRRVAAGGPAGGCVIRDGIISYATPSLASLFDADPADIEDVPFTDLVAPSDREQVADQLATLERPVEMRFSIDAADSNGDGDAGPARVLRAQWRPQPEEGVIVGTILDVTDQERRIRELRRDAAMLDSLLENIPLSIYFKDRQSRHERVSNYMTKNNPEEYIKNDEGKIHPHAADLLGKTDFDLYEQAFADEAIADDRRVIEEGAIITDRIESAKTGNGEEIYTATTKAPRYDSDGNIVGLVGVTLEITDRVRYRKELERHNERLEEFAEVLTHDLRNPVNVAQGYIDVLQEEYDPDAVDACDRALERISRLIDEIREFVLQGRTVDSPKPVDLQAVARQAWATVDTGDAELVIETDQRIQADPDRLQRLFENLFRNSVDHGSASPASHTQQSAVDHGSTSPDSRVPPDSVDYGSTSPASHTLEDDRSTDSDDRSALTVRLEWTGSGFAVVDDGAGLPETEGDTDLLFERGYTTAAAGTGFGLAIVRDIAEAHGWEVSATTGADGGARFEFDDVVTASDEMGQTYGT